MFVFFSGKDIRKEWNMLKSTYSDNFRENDGSSTYYRMADIQLVKKFIKLNEEERQRLDERQQREFELKVGVMIDDEVLEFDFGH